MKTKIVKINPIRPQKDKMREIAYVLKQGKLVVFPTETVYGIAANSKSKKAMLRLRKLKERPKSPFSFHIASKTDLKRLNCILDKSAKRLINKFWPGPLTLVLKTSAGQKIGVRMPKHPVAVMLLKETAADIVAPSANFKSENPATDAKQAVKELNGLVDIIIDAGKTKVGISSTVLDLTEKPARILREGSIKREAIEKITGELG